MFKLKLLAGVASVVGFCGAASAQYPQPLPQYPVFPQPLPQYPMYVPPSVPLFVTPNTPFRINPLTGGIDTSNTQINSSAFDPGRDAARFNGSMRSVDRPIYDVFGNVTGRQSGVEWFNPLAGRWHSDVNNVTPNGLGGVHNNQMITSAPPSPQAVRATQPVNGAANKPTQPPSGHPTGGYTNR